MSDTLSVVDNRTGKKYELPIQDGTIRAMDLRQIKAAPEDFGLMTYDPAFMNTANCRSAITYIHGHNGILLSRGSPIDPHAAARDYPTTPYLHPSGRVPTRGAGGRVVGKGKPLSVADTLWGGVGGWLRKLLGNEVRLREQRQGARRADVWALL